MIITLKHIYKIIGGEISFENLNMEIKESQRVGLVGRNGSGKSTLFNILTKEEAVDGGDVFIQKGAAIGCLKQMPSHWTRSGREYLRSAFQELLEIEAEMKALEQKMMVPEHMEEAVERYGSLQEQFADRGGYEVESSIRQVAHGLKVHHLLDQPFDTLSGGEKTKLGFAKLLLEKPDVLLLDEPTNHLDLKAVEWLEGFLQQYPGTLCIISHDRFFLDRVVTDILDLDSGSVESYKGNYSSFEKQKEEKLLIDFHHYEEQQKKIKKLKDAVRRLRQWANEASPPSEKLFKKAKSMERALGRMEKIDKPVMDPKRMKLSLEAGGRSGKDVFIVDGGRKAYGESVILKGFNLHVRYQDRLAVVGSNGSGKSTLLRLLLEEERLDEGTIKRAPGMKIGYLPQHPLKEADPDQRMIDFYRTSIRVTEGEARSQLAGFLFYGYDVFRKIRHLSGGEQMRLKLAIFMQQDLHVLLLDEPTNHLDIESQEVLEEALGRFSGTVIGVSHDRHFLNRCFQETMYLAGGRGYRYSGTYEETKHHWPDEKEEEAEKELPPETVEETASLEDQIAGLEEEGARLEKELENALSSEVERLKQKKQKLDARLEALYESWLEEAAE
ncbi:ATP-binding cassette domain-containing protein [Halobacillus halophilus]|uniref:ribosomal protection-like ABC-F family protein n=1 Tax=Halobacillus halophilus TaxID=1570 RepID=UPI00136DD7B2|nr:ABC-F family ATP-binding cassette domain-containing protein [Halobacillus halophilus]MYL31666.1 ATP-binding cassette domain-containing protein [Halobacillus halophilus]